MNGIMATQAKNDQILFCMTFGLLSLLLFGILGLMPDGLYAPVTTATASISETLLSALGYAAVRNGNYIKVDGFLFEIVPECTAVFIAAIYLAFVLSYPASRKSKLAGVLSGIPLIFMVNQFRVLVLCIFGIERPALFEITHPYAGQIFMTAFLVLMVAAWLRLSAADKPLHQSAGFLLRFFIISSLLFFPWVFLNREYMRLIDFVVGTGFSWAGREVAWTIKTRVYYETFNFIIFSGLWLAHENMDRRSKLKMLVWGVSIIAAGHMGIRVFKVLSAAFGIQGAAAAGNALHMFTLYLMPILLCLYFKQRYARRHTSLPCPVCGKPQRSLARHIRRKHGKNAYSKSDLEAYVKGRTVNPLELG